MTTASGNIITRLPVKYSILIIPKRVQLVFKRNNVVIAETNRQTIPKRNHMIDKKVQ